jgi:hypothetical protein
LKVTAEDLLLWSVRQAMAGPDNEITSAELCRKPVFELAKRIYNAHLDRINRRKEKGGVVGGRSVELEQEKIKPEQAETPMPEVGVRAWAERQGLSEDEEQVLSDLHEACELEHWEPEDAIGAWSIGLGYLRDDMDAADRNVRLQFLQKVLTRWEGTFDAERARSVIEQAISTIR